MNVSARSRVRSPRNRGGMGSTGDSSGQATNILFSSIGRTSLTVSWTNGIGTKRIVVVRSGSAVNAIPTNNQTYNANTVFGTGDQVGTSNYVVYNGSGSSVTITGLTTNITYHVRVFEYTGLAGSEQYITSIATRNPRSQLTDNITSTALAYWDFNSDQIDLFDVKSLTHNTQAVATTQLTVVPGKLGNAIWFLPARGFTISDSPALSFGNAGTDAPFSFSYWYNAIEYNIAQFILSKGNASVKEYEMQVMTTRKVRFGVFTDASNSLYAESNGTLALPGTWNCITCTYDGSKTFAGIKIYINGVLQTTTNVSAGSYTGMSDTAANLFIGNNYTVGSSSLGTRGYLDEMGLYAYELSQANVNELYNSGNAVAFLQPMIYVEPKQVLANRNQYMLSTDNTNLYWSSDYGATWTAKSPAWGTQWIANVAQHALAIMSAYIFSDGSVLMCTARTAYWSSDGLQTINTSTLLETNGSTLSQYTPANPIYPGSWFTYPSTAIQEHVTVDGVEMVVWGNYANVASMELGGSPAQFWYSKDKGRTVKRFYRAGDNSANRDDGTNDGGPTGNVIGDITNPLIVRHMHSITNKPGTAIFYACSGDAVGENQWWKFTYNSVTDSWAVTNLRTNQGNTKWKSTGIQVDGNNIYFVGDAAAAIASERGVFRGTETDIINDTCTQIYDPGATTLTIYMMNKTTGRVLVCGESPPYGSSFGLIDNYGAGAIKNVFVQGIDSANILNRGFPADDRGYYKLNRRGFFTNPLGTLFIKV
jgi:hypothetical protein